MKRSLLTQVYPTYILVVLVCTCPLGRGHRHRPLFRERFRQNWLIDLIAITENRFFPAEPSPTAEGDIDGRLKQLFAGRLSASPF
jgi:hypothetical protein